MRKVIMKEYAHILHALADGKEVQWDFGNGCWVPQSASQNLVEIAERMYAPERYRIKPATININGFEVPEPMREAPRAGDRVWVPALLGPEKITDDFLYSTNSDYGRTYFSRGLCHSTKEAAELHAKALLSFTAKP